MLEAYDVGNQDDSIREIIVTKSPSEILTTLCEEMLEKQVSAVVHISDNEYGAQKTASAKYIIKMASFLGLPIITWIGDNSEIIQVCIIS